MDSGEIVVPSIISGVKREHNMMLNDQLELNRSQNASSVIRVYVRRNRKTAKRVVLMSNTGHDSRNLEEKFVALDRPQSQPLPQVEGTDTNFNHEDGSTLGGGSGFPSERTEEKSPLPHVGGTDADFTHDSDLGFERPRLEMKMSKKVKLASIPLTLNHLLGTGLLEGLCVSYITGSKGKKNRECRLRGVISGTGILCSCDKCKGVMVIPPIAFENHADSGNKRPPGYIYLDNGKSLRDVLNACKDNESELLASVIQKAIGHINFTMAFCINCNELIPESAASRPLLLCDSSILPKESDPSNTQSSVAAHSCQPEVSESANVSSNSHPQRKCQGKLTRKYMGMHKSVLAEDVLPDGTDLLYIVGGKIKLTGFKKDGAIFCSHCDELVSPSKFEGHAGFPDRRKPYMNIYTSNGVSLHQISLDLSKNRKLSSKENDDLCSICQVGGDLLFCEHCPRSFHHACAGLSFLPQEAWYCQYCKNMFERKKSAKQGANAIAADITLRCIRTVATLEADVGGCAICRGHDFCRSGFGDRTVIICDQCDKEYHVGCLREKMIDDLKTLPQNEWFCSQTCGAIHSTLQKLITDGEQFLPECLFPEPVIRWRLLSGKRSNEDTRPWLSGAVSIFHDRFDPIALPSSAHHDLIPHMVYGRKIKGQDFCGMYCAVLMVDAVVVSAGILRIFGDEVAELPLVATRSECQGKGYFKSLYFCIEKLLASLSVKELVLPAAHEAESLWRNRFGFMGLDQEQLRQYQKRYQLRIFEGTSVLHKAISKSPDI